MRLYVKCDRCGRFELGIDDYSASEAPIPPAEWRTVRSAKIERNTTVRPDIDKLVCGACFAVVSAAINAALKPEAATV